MSGTLLIWNEEADSFQCYQVILRNKTFKVYKVSKTLQEAGKLI